MNVLLNALQNWIAKLDRDGTILWIHQLKNGFGKEYAEGVVVNDDGSVEIKNKINIKETGDFVLYYWALPKDLTAEGVDLDNYEYEVAPHTHVAIPAFIGYQLVKTDDVQLAQILLNEWNKYLSLFDDKTKTINKKIRNTIRWW